MQEKDPLTQFGFFIRCSKLKESAKIQKQPSRGVLKKLCSENMQQI